MSRLEKEYREANEALRIAKRLADRISGLQNMSTQAAHAEEQTMGVAKRWQEFGDFHIRVSVDKFDIPHERPLITVPGRLAAVIFQKLLDSISAAINEELEGCDE